MGIKQLVAKAGGKAADKVARLAVLSPDQLKEVQKNREKYLTQMPSMDDEAAEELTSRLLAACCTEVYNSYLQKLQEYYVPVKKDFDLEGEFNSVHNIRYFNITKWVTDKKENNIEKLINVYEVLSDANCNIALVFNRKTNRTDVYLAVVNLNNSDENTEADNYIKRLIDAIKGNFPGAEWKNEGMGVLPCLDNATPYSVACASNIPGEKSEKFISQTIEKLIDGIVPTKMDKEYTIVLLATPVNDIENRKIHLAELYSGLAPYAGWETNFTFTESDATTSNATFGVNVGASAGVQQGQNSANTTSQGITNNSSETNTNSQNEGVADSINKSNTQTNSETNSESVSKAQGETATNSNSVANSQSDSNSFEDREMATTDSHSDSTTNTKGDSISKSATETMANSVARSVANSVAESTGKSISNSVGKSIANTLGKAVTDTVSATNGMYKGVNLGANVGANFARSSNVTATVGKNEGIVQHFTNYNIKHLLENLEMQMKRLEQSTALGMWDFAAYILSEDLNVANNVAYSYLALTQGETSYTSQTAVNVWRGDMVGTLSDNAKEICSYIRDLRHPVFALSPNLSKEIPISNVYPPVVTPTVGLSGKELAYSLNFPQKSITGLPVLQCAEFGRNISRYDIYEDSENTIHLGNIFNMNHEEPVSVDLNLQSLASHTFITGSTGSGKSNTVYKIILEAIENDLKFMVIEPAKGEYKDVLGNRRDVNVYGTNPQYAEILRINPFSFPDKIHIFEHLDRLVEIFNVCWPMYAAMPAVLKSAIQKSYEDCGWDLTESTNSYGQNLFPSFGDVARNIKNIIDNSEYDTDNKGAYKGSLLTRLNSLTDGINGLIFTNDEIPASVLFEENTIVDLSRVGSNETKSLIMGMLVLKLQEYRIATQTKRNNKANHLTVIEEAHNLLKRSSADISGEGGNLIGKSVEMLTNAIAEMRTYGEGFVIVDQAPGLLDMAAIRNTNTKIIMRLPDKADRELVGYSANLNEEQITEIAKIPKGVAAIYQNDWVQPVLCKIQKADDDSGVYEYERIPIDNNQDDINFKLNISSWLSNGTKISDQLYLNDIRDGLRKNGLNAYTIVSILKMLTLPATEPRMSRMGPVMCELFPRVKKAFERSYSETSDKVAWTKAAEDELISEVGNIYNNQLRRDIIQSIVTYYLSVEVNRLEILEAWQKEGGLK